MNIQRHLWRHIPWGMWRHAAKRWRWIFMRGDEYYWGAALNIREGWWILMRAWPNLHNHEYVIRPEVNVGSVCEVRGHAECAWGSDAIDAFHNEIDAFHDAIYAFHDAINAFMTQSTHFTTQSMHSWRNRRISWCNRLISRRNRHISWRNRRISRRNRRISWCD